MCSKKFQNRLTNKTRYFFLFFLGGGSGVDVTARQDYFTHFEPRRSVGEAKMGDPRKKINAPDHPQAELGLSHVTRASIEPTAVR